MKKIWVIIITILLFIAMFPCHASEDRMENAMVYAAGSEQDAIYKLLQKDSFDFKKALDSWSLTVVKESISTVYTVDMLEYAETGDINIHPMAAGEAKNDSKNNTGNVYIAKTITPKQEYGGNLMFYIENNAAHYMSFSPSGRSNDSSDSISVYKASCSYADHAARIQACLKEDKFVSVYDIKYVFVDLLGDFFYVNNNKHNTLMSVGYMSSDASCDGFTAQADAQINIGNNELKALANDQLTAHKAFMQEKEQWEKEHPGELWDRTGTNDLPPLISKCSRVDNIQNIAEYLNIDMKPSPSFSHNTILLYCFIPLVICITTAWIAAMVYRKRSREN